MNQKSNTAAVISNITWIGFVIALCIRDKSDQFTTHHINQALILNILGMLGSAIAVLPLIGKLVSGVIGVAVLVLWVMGIYRAATWRMDPLPIIGDIRFFN